MFKKKKSNSNQSNPSFRGVQFSEIELTFPRVTQLIKELIQEKLQIQKREEYYSFNEFELEVLIKKFGDFVPTDRYDNQTEFKGERGKIKGKRVVVE